ncbi:hypothetical protein BKA66DRAFT_454095 [Pyrenochaeta sp. MPI-SDFR-AT-0127]|nr:hypothetical protein BKA66DRAFT_454095 [Pyrenochaeta sp. MPI-SDFR-AT-0127]
MIFRQYLSSSMSIWSYLIYSNACSVSTISWKEPSIMNGLRRPQRLIVRNAHGIKDENTRWRASKFSSSPYVDEMAALRDWTSLAGSDRHAAERPFVR